MKLALSGTTNVAAPRERVWAGLMDPHFVARSAPGVESVQVVDDEHFQLITAFGIGAFKIRFTVDVERYDVVDGEHAALRARGNAAGSHVDVTSNVRLDDAGSGHAHLHWTVTSELTGPVAGFGAQVMEGAAHKLIEQFWRDFAARVAAQPGG